MTERNYCRKCGKTIFVGKYCFDCKDLLEEVERDEDSKRKIRSLAEFDK